MSNRENDGAEHTAHTSQEYPLGKWFHWFIWALIVGMGLVTVYLFMEHFFGVIL